MRGIFRFAIVLLSSASLCGCQTLGETSLIASTAPQDISPAAAATIAQDLSGALVGHVGVGTNTLSFDTDGSVFGQALERVLRSEGYAISTDQSLDLDPGIVPLAYVVDRFDGSVLVRLSTPGLNLTRIYAVSGEEAEPISPWSVMEIAQGKIG